MSPSTSTSSTMVTNRQKPSCDYCVKAILLGDLGVGKTTVLQTYVRNHPMSRQQPDVSTFPPAFVSNVVWYQNKRVKVTIWDTAGQERYRSMTASYYRGAHACIIVYDVDNPESFENLGRWIESIKDYSGGQNMLTILIGNRKGDNSIKPLVDTQRALKFASHMQLPIFEMDCCSEPDKLDYIMETLVALVMVKANESPALSYSIKPQPTQLTEPKNQFRCSACCSTA